MDQSTHAWLALEAFKKIKQFADTDVGKQKKTDRLVELLGSNIRDIIVASWLPDSLIKDMTYGHVFKNSLYKGDQAKRFQLSKEDLKKNIRSGSAVASICFEFVPKNWWERPYRVKVNGGHLPARISSICQNIRDMLKMGNADVIAITGRRARGAEIIASELLFTPKNIATMFWMLSHYIADAHMPFHCDNRGLASTNDQHLHCDVEKFWGKQIPSDLHSGSILSISDSDILTLTLSKSSWFAGIDFGKTVSPLRNGSDEWKEAVYICRASFANSFALVPPDIADVDDKQTVVTLDDIKLKQFCGTKRFKEISRAIMEDAINSIASFWLNAWDEYVKPSK